MIKRLIAGVLFCICVVSLAGWFFYQFLITPISARSYPVRIFIPERSTLRATAELLATENLITHQRLFSLWARVTKADRKIQSGEYLFTTTLAPIDLLRILMRGETLR